MDLKNLAALVVAAAGLITSVGAFMHKPPEVAARAGYLELTTAILDVQAGTKANHDDLVALHAYLDGYVKSHESIVTPIPSVATFDSGFTVPSGPVAVYPTYTAKPGESPGVVTHVLSSAPSAAMPPPPPAAPPVSHTPKAFDSLL